MSETPDRLGNGVRFGCGFMLGAALGLSMTLYLIPQSWAVVAGCAVMFGLIFGFAAMHWGDEFWSWFADNLWWMP